MRYAALIYAEEAGQDPNEEPSPEAMQPWFDFGAKNEQYLRGGEALLPTNTATTIRVRDGEVVTTDGPFAETKEALGGFYLIEAADLDEAIDIARQIPAADYGSIEVRPIMEIPDPS